MGVSDNLRQQLASADMVVLYGGCGIVWNGSAGTSFDKRALARGQHHAVVSVVKTIDRRALAERICGGSVWIASVARGIGGVGVRTQGRVKRIVLHANPADVCTICEKQSHFSGVGCQASGCPRLLVGGFLFYAGADEQADVGDLAVCAVATGLLAAKPICTFNPQIAARNCFAFGIGKTAVPCVQPGFFGGYTGGTAGSCSTFRSHPASHSGRH